MAPVWLLRLGAGLAAGGLAAGCLEVLASAPEPLSPTAAGALTAIAVALLPRIGWLLGAAALLAWVASPEIGLPGTALVLAAALLPTPFLLPRAGLLWSVPALAPLLGAIGLAPLFVAVAGLASTVWRRAGLALAGFAWLAAAELLSGRSLLFGPDVDAEPASTWETSLLDAARDAVLPALISPAIVVGPVWAALAVALGLAVRDRPPALAVVGAVLWAAALIVAHEWLADLLAEVAATPVPSGAVAGAVLGAAAAFAAGVGLRRARSNEGFVP